MDINDDNVLDMKESRPYLKRAMVEFLGKNLYEV
jgi:hypothetical protein